VASRLFQISPETPVEIQVQLDQPGPLRVIHSGIVVAASAAELIVQPQIPSADGLRLSAEISGRAIESLPETPVTAVGVNVRYTFSEVPDMLMPALGSVLDEKLIDAEMTVISKSIKRAVTWKDGVLNIEIRTNPDNSCDVLFNFHRQSSKVKELRGWLHHADPMIASAKNFLTHRFGLKLEEVNVE
jgi:hypothetical protein